MIAKKLGGTQYCCCNDTPTYMGEKGNWVALCLHCGRSIGPFKTAGEAKKQWNKELKELHKKWREEE